MKAVGIVIALFLVIVGFGVASLHTSNATFAPADIFSTSLQQNPSASGTLNTGSVYVYKEANFQISLPQVGGVYYENGYPIIYSTFSTSNAASTYFSQALWVNYTNDYVANAPTFGLSITYNYYVLSGNQEYQTVSGSYNAPDMTPSSSSESYGPFQIFDNAFFKGPLTGIVVINVAYKFYGTNDNVANSITTVTGSLSREVYIGQTSAGVSAPSPVSDGQTFQITYSTGYGESYTGNNVGPFYQMLIYGSQAYNGGALVKTINLNPDVTDGSVSFTMPSKAWVYSTNANDNNWKVTVTNGYFEYNVYTLVAVKSLALIPPAPTITIENTPSSGHWIWGDQVEVLVHTYPNTNSEQKITSINVFVYTGASENAPSYYVVGSGGNPLTVQVTNNNATFAFTMPQTSENVYVQVNSFDAGGETSAWAYQIIGANQIFHSKSQSQTASDTNLALEVGIGAAAIAGAALIMLFAPVDVATRAIIAAGYVIMLLIILNSYVAL